MSTLVIDVVNSTLVESMTRLCAFLRDIYGVKILKVDKLEYFFFVNDILLQFYFVISPDGTLCPLSKYQ